MSEEKSVCIAVLDSLAVSLAAAGCDGSLRRALKSKTVLLEPFGPLVTALPAASNFPGFTFCARRRLASGGFTVSW